MTAGRRVHALPVAVLAAALAAGCQAPQALAPPLAHNFAIDRVAPPGGAQPGPRFAPTPPEATAAPLPASGPAPAPAPVPSPPVATPSPASGVAPGADAARPSGGSSGGSGGGSSGGASGAAALAAPTPPPEPEPTPAAAPEIGVSVGDPQLAGALTVEFSAFLEAVPRPTTYRLLEAGGMEKVTIAVTQAGRAEVTVTIARAAIDRGLAAHRFVGLALGRARIRLVALDEHDQAICATSRTSDVDPEAPVPVPPPGSLKPDLEPIPATPAPATPAPESPAAPAPPPGPVPLDLPFWSQPNVLQTVLDYIDLTMGPVERETASYIFLAHGGMSTPEGQVKPEDPIVIVEAEGFFWPPRWPCCETPDPFRYVQCYVTAKEGIVMSRRLSMQPFGDRRLPQVVGTPPPPPSPAPTPEPTSEPTSEPESEP